MKSLRRLRWRSRRKRLIRFIREVLSGLAFISIKFSFRERLLVGVLPRDAALPFPELL